MKGAHRFTLQQLAHRPRSPDIEPGIEHVVARLLVEAGGKASLRFARLPRHHRQLCPLAQIVQGLQFRRGQHPGHTVDQAQGANVVALAVLQRPPCVEANPRLACHQGVVGESVVLRRIFDDKNLIAENGMATERHIAQRVALRQTQTALEPLSVVVHQRDQDDGGLKNQPGRSRHAVQRPLVRGVQQVHAAQGVEAFYFIGRQCRSLHDWLSGVTTGECSFSMPGTRYGVETSVLIPVPRAP